MLRTACILVATGVAQLAAAVAVLHHGVDDPELTRERVGNILTGRVSTWRGGGPIVIILLDGQRCVSELTGRDVARLTRGWKRLVFAGSAAMPLQADSLPEALRLVTLTPGAVLVLDEAPSQSGVTIVPLDAGTD